MDDALIHEVDQAITLMSRHMEVVALTDAEDDDSMTLHLPDGSEHVVQLAPDDHEAFRMTPEIRQLIEQVQESPQRGHRRTGHAVAN